MEKGKYFSKPRLLSEKVDELIEGLESADPIGLAGFPKSFFTQTLQPYQQYYHQICGPSDFYCNYYGISGASKPSKSIEPQPKMKGKQPQSQQQRPKSKKQKKPKKAANAPKGNDNDLPAIGRCIFTVGKVLEISDHSNADTMFVEQIDLGEDEPRTICSGIKGRVTKEEMLGSLVIVFSNLKKAKLRGIDSNGMVLAASSVDHSKCEMVRPPEGSVVGERVVLEDEDLTQYQPSANIKAKKKNNPWNDIKPDLKTNGECMVCYKGRRFVTSKGPLFVKSLANAQVQ